MNEDQTFRVALIVGSVLVLPVMAYFRIRSQATGEPLDRRKEGKFILYTLRPLAIAPFGGLFAFMIDPKLMAWSSLPLPTMVRWAGVGISVLAGFLILWTLRNLGRNLTDTVVTRKEHTLVSSGPYRWVRHPFYISGAMFVMGNGLAAANWFFLITGAAVIALLVIRTRREEEELLRRFGEPYRAYVERTGRFIPKLAGRQAPGR
jgi:protein-S-isoprenylcysteine O-methyltransferase Ste14